MDNILKMRINAPWSIENPIGWEHPSIIDKDGRRIAIVSAPYPATQKTEDIYARLIISAPDLYQALYDLLSRVENDRDARMWFVDEQIAAKKALEKAVVSKN